MGLRHLTQVYEFHSCHCHLKSQVPDCSLSPHPNPFVNLTLSSYTIHSHPLPHSSVPLLHYIFLHIARSQNKTHTLCWDGRMRKKDFSKNFTCHSKGSSWLNVGCRQGSKVLSVSHPLTAAAQLRASPCHSHCRTG